MDFPKSAIKKIHEFSASPLFRKLVQILGIDLLVRASGFLLLPVYLRLMPQHEFGLYSYLYSFSTVAAIVLNFGLYIPLAKYYHEKKSDNNFSKNALFTIALLFLFFYAIVSITLICTNTDLVILNQSVAHIGSTATLRLAYFLLVTSGVFNFMLSYFFVVSEKIKVLTVYNLLRVITINLSSLLALFYFQSASNSAIIRIYAFSISELFLFLFFAKYFIKECGTSFQLSLVKPLLKLSLPVLGSAVLGVIINFSDKYILEKNVSLTKLSSFYLAVTFAGIIPMLAASLQNAWLPDFLKADLKTAHRKTQLLIKKYVLALLIISVLIEITLYLLLTLGAIESSYYEALLLCPLLLLSQIFISLTTLNSNYLIHLGKTQFTFISAIVICCISIPLNLYLIRTKGTYGAGISSILINGLYLLFYMLLLRILLKKNPTPAYVQ